MKRNKCTYLAQWRLNVDTVTIRHTPGANITKSPIHRLNARPVNKSDAITLPNGLFD